jgi:ankyrin repeat protein
VQKVKNVNNLGATPLHNAFRSSNYSIICKCLLGAVPPNLNVVDDDGKTPLAYCCRKILEMLGLQDGVVSVVPG